MRINWKNKCERAKPTQRWVLIIKRHSASDTCENSSGEKIKTLKNGLLHENMEKTGKNRNNTFRTLEIKQRLTAIRGIFIQEKWQYLSMYEQWALWYFSCPIPNQPLLLDGSFGNQQPAVMVKINNLAAIGGGRTRLEFNQSFISRELSLSDLLGSSLEHPTYKAVFLRPIQSLHSVKNLFPGDICRKLLEAIV